MASGDGPWLPKFKDGFGGRREFDPPAENKLSELPPNPTPPDPVGEVAGGLEAEAVGRGGTPELNSAQRGHFRLVSVEARSVSAALDPH